MMNFVSDILLPDPSGTVDQAARQTFLNMYSGLLFSPLVPIVTPDGRIVFVLAEDRTVMIDAEDRTAEVLVDDRTVFVRDPG